jgi:hypothetical protein
MCCSKKDRKRHSVHTVLANTDTTVKNTRIANRAILQHHIVPGNSHHPPPCKPLMPSTMQIVHKEAKQKNTYLSIINWKSPLSLSLSLSLSKKR